MLFSSVTFLVYFLPIAILVYYMVPARFKNLVILVESLFFYSWGEPVYILLMITSIIINYASGIAISNIKSCSKFTNAFLILNVSVNLALLGFFKYADFAINNVNVLFGTDFNEFKLPLPIGISFYTFQAMSYIIDLYRGKVRVQKNLINFAVYISMFPQLIAGPIVRFKTVEEQLNKRTHSFELFRNGVVRFTFGLAKKVILANNLGQIWSHIDNQEIFNLSPASVWIAAFSFALQIYFDFSGYSDMAIGLGKMFGFTFDENFNYPYVSKSVTEFWRRWHISLGTWFKEYLYIPLGGNRKGNARQILNIMLVWSLTGLWHGASWNFAIWGTYFGVFLVMEKMFILRIMKAISNRSFILGEVIARIYTCIVVVLSWLIFSVTDTNRLIAMFNIIFTNGGKYSFSGNPFWKTENLYLLSSNALILIVAIAVATGLPTKIYANFVKKRLAKGGNEFEIYEVVYILLLLFLSFAFVVSSTYNPFLYFRF
ncbi:MAG: MBOAT family O-acyltransferase [Eubacteriales bacterium]